MSDGRKRLSGAKCKQQRLDKQDKHKKLLSKVPNIATFFGNTQCSKPEASSRQDVISVDDHTKEDGDKICDHIEKAIEDTGNNDTEEETKPCDIIENSPTTICDDPALWKIGEEIRDYVAMHGVKQNTHFNFKDTAKVYSDKTRYLSADLFKKTLKNGEITYRNWLVYSESKKCVFCVPCLLFSKSASDFATGFCDWKNSMARVQSHENSALHKSSVAGLKQRGATKGRIDQTLLKQLDEEIDYWRNVLQRVAATVKSLAIRGLPFRGSDEHFGSLNNGNYLSTLELIAEFDPFLRQHIQRSAKIGSGHTSYLSKTICNEFIELMKSKLATVIINEAKAAKYYGISVDSTPDISHVDQLTFIIRYVSNDGSPVERFLTFIPNSGHKSEQLANTIFETLANHGLDVQDCRGQSYDNASNMSGAYSGVQARIKQRNNLACYVPCAAHSLNLVGSCAADCCSEAVNFFRLIQEVFNFFSASTHRWEILQSCKDPQSQVLKSSSSTRWSARHEACEALWKGLPQILTALKRIASDGTEKKITQCEARGIVRQLDRSETAIMANLWGLILKRFNLVNLKLQSVNIDIGSVVELYHSLGDFVQSIRDDFDHFEETAKAASAVQEYEKDQKRTKKRKLRVDESPSTEVLHSESGQDNFRINTFNVIIDSLNAELQRRGQIYAELHEKFSFLERLKVLEVKEVRESAEKLLAFYNEDLEDSIVEECLHLRSHLEHLIPGEYHVSIMTLNSRLRETGFQDIYPNVEIAMRIFLCSPATNCSGERSFSTLKRVKSYLRASLSQERLNGLALLCIEKNLLRDMDCEEIINDFAARKARKKYLQ